MQDYSERSAYPHVEDFKVMRPEYADLEDGLVQATITIAPFKVVGRSVTTAGARRAAIYESAKMYRSYHPSFRIDSPFPEVFTDREGVRWKRVAAPRRTELGDYMFVDEYDEEDYADIETMLIWDVRPAEDEASVEE
jgi:hypothetical protein